MIRAYLKNLDMLYLMFKSAHMVLKEKFGHVILNVCIYAYGFERKFWCMLYVTIKETLVTTYLQCLPYASHCMVSFLFFIM